MKILVCISNVPDTTTKIKFTGDNELDTTGIQWVINPWDELSLTRALELKDSNPGLIESVTVAHVGPASSEPTIRKALAIGADSAIRVNAEPLDAFFVAAQMEKVIAEDKFDIVLCGIESSDFNGSTLGGMLAEFLGYPSVSAVSGINIENEDIIIKREIDGGSELVSVPVPFVAIVQKGIALEPRIAAMRGIMMARKKPIKVIEPADVEALTEVSSYEMPPEKEACKFIDPDNPEELIDILQNKEKLI
ncbi:MAG TPA: electron transfer flavoprotein subunit beta/FixA family protein [Bacteroidales bacterium]|nr:electron transfer flavoprotein subunit beta/FixA family protein [Bacteroidales bacterium]